MKRDWRSLAPVGYWLALGLLLASGAWYIVNRQFDVTLRLGLGLAVVAAAAGVLLDPERLRQALTGRQARFGSNAVLISLAFAGILGVANYLAFSNPGQVDLTEDRTYSLTPETILTLEELKLPVVVEGFYTPASSSTRDNIRPLLEQYQLHAKGKLTFEFIDPQANPVAADKYGVTRDATLVVVMGQASQVLASATEQEITSALVRLANPEQRKVYFLTGHGEHDIQAGDTLGYSQVRSALEAKNYKVATLSLLSTPNVPKDSLVLIVAGYAVPLSQNEISAIKSYVDGGGSLIVLAEPTVTTKVGDSPDPLAAYLEQAWAVRLDDDLVVDLNSTMPLAGIADRYGDHPITAKMRNLATYFPTARSLTLETDKAGGIVQTALVLTGQNSWGKTDKQAISQGTLNRDASKDAAGPLTLAVSAEDPTKQARVVVFGDSDFAANGDFFGLGNGDLLVNSIDWAARQEQLISLTPKPSTQRFVTPPSTQAVGLIFLISVLAIPAAVIILGVSVWLGRRRRD